MKHTESNFIGMKGFKIHYQKWVPETKPKAIIQIVHGFAEHSGRYLNIVNKLVPLGYTIYANDHRGHGKSEGITNYVERFNDFIIDLKKFYDIIRNEYPSIPLYMLGHSMGSCIAMFFVKQYESLLNGLILSGTGTSVGEETSKILKLMSHILSKIAPKMTIDPKLDPESLSHDPDVVKKYKEDPLVHYKIVTMRLANEMLYHFNKLEDVVPNFKIPLLIQCGAEDQAVTGIQDLKEKFRMSDKTIIIYENLFHEVYNEKEESREKVLQDLADWLEKRV